MFTVRTFKKGFTLVELMVVMAVIAILATIAFFGLSRAQAAARDTQRQQAMNGLRAALERYFGDNGYYPGPGPVGNQWSGNVGSPIDTLVAAGYITAGPTDPCAGGTAIPATGIMAVCTPTTYAYAPLTSAGGACTTAGKNCAKYTLTLTKESGGTSNFANPQ